MKVLVIPSYVSPSSTASDGLPFDYLLFGKNKPWAQGTSRMPPHRNYMKISSVKWCYTQQPQLKKTGNS